MFSLDMPRKSTSIPGSESESLVRTLRENFTSGHIYSYMHCKRVATYARAMWKRALDLIRLEKIFIVGSRRANKPKHTRTRYASQ